MSASERGSATKQPLIFAAKFFAANSARHQDVRVKLDQNFFELRLPDSQDVVFSFSSNDEALDSIDVNAAAGACFVRFRDGRLLVAVDIKQDQAQRLAALAAPFAVANKLEARFKFAIAAFVAAIGLAVLAWQYVLPKAAVKLADQVSPGLLVGLDKQVVEQLDADYFMPSTLPADLSAAVDRKFKQARDVFRPDFQVELLKRDGGAIGANALALPGGTVIVTDQLVEVLGASPRLTAVLLHEFAHVRHRHALRQTLQTAGTALVLSAVFADLSSLASLGPALIEMLLGASYSRDAEREADLTAAKAMAEIGADPKLLADALTALTADRESCQPEDVDASLLDSHPSIKERIEFLTFLSKQRAQPETP